MDAIVSMFGDFAPIAPMIILIIGALIMPAIYMATKSRGAVTGAMLIFTLASMLFNVLMLSSGYAGEYAGLFKFDAFSGLMILLFQIVVFLVAMVSGASTEVTRMHYGAYAALLLGATVGMMFVAVSTDLIGIFVGVELTSISSYVLVALKRKDPRSAEAAVKYVIIGGVSTALTVYGLSMLYGITGTTSIAAVVSQLSAGGFTWAFAISMATLIAGYGFKIAAVPFHMWAPDVYEGAPTPVSAFLVAGSKKMGLVVFFKIFLVMFAAAPVVAAFGVQEMQYAFAIIAALTMTVGNVVAIAQNNIKRMLAYSSIAQAGYILIVMAVMTPYALTGGIFHMFTHVFMKGGAFLIVGALISIGIGEKIADYKGLSKRSPFIAFAMLLFLFALAGIPPLAGFTSKFVLFSAAIQTPTGATSVWIWLAFIAILNSAISLYYYARVVKAMYIEEGDSKEKIKIPAMFTIAIVICVVAVIILGIFPQIILGPAADAALLLLGF